MKRNIFLTITGLETLLVGIFLGIQNDALLDDPHDRFVHFTYYMGNMTWSIILIIAGLATIAIGLSNCNKWHLQSAALILMSAVWCAYFVVFLVQDLHFSQPLHLGTILVGMVFLRILVEARYGGD